MQRNNIVAIPEASSVKSQNHAVAPSPAGIRIGLLTGCQDRPYAFGLAMALVAKNISVEIVGGDEIDSPEFHSTQNLRFLNFRGKQKQECNLAEKLWSLLVYYARLAVYAGRNDPPILHILWNNKVEIFDRTVLMLYYKLMGKRVLLTAHNVNQGRRDGTDSFLNRITLRIQYRLCDHIFVHTNKMKDELCQEFGVPRTAVTIIRHPINNAFADTALTPLEAKRKLAIREGDKAILFFGRLRPYKGLEDLLAAFRVLVGRCPEYKLILASEPKKGSEAYRDEIQHTIEHDFQPGRVVTRIQFIPDDEMEIYLKAADVLVLPYKDIFQSGVLFLAYSYGLPVIATDVGSFREEIVDGETGFVCRPGSIDDLAMTLEKYFASDLYQTLPTGRSRIREYARRVHSWDAVAELTQKAYKASLGS